MAKHVYPPWYSPVQKALFAVAVILCITLPVTYGESHAFSSTTIIVVLILYFVAWAIFSLAMRFGIKSYTVESQLPIYTPTPAPPEVLHVPASRDAVPAAPAIKVSPTLSAMTPSHTAVDAGVVAGRKNSGSKPRGARFADIDSDDDENNNDSHQQQRSAAALTPPPPAASRTGAASKQQLAVSFQTRPRGFTTDSTNSENYPTFAAYRQAQHANFDAFAQRIRRALETASVENQMRQQQEEEQEGIQIEQKEQLNLHDLLVHEPKLDPENGQQHTDAERPSISQPLPALPPASLSVIRSSAVASVGRPRSSSTASMISNLSEKIRIGSNIFGRTGRSRAGSDASITPASPTTAQPHHSSLSTETPMSSSSTTMAAIASASAIASAMTLPRSSAYTPDTTCNSAAGDSGVVEAPGGGKTKRASARHSGLAHPLAESAHIDDKSEDHDRWDESSKNGSNP